MRIGIDIDGVLADFNNPYRDLVHKFSDIRLPEISDTYPDSWDYAVVAGLDKKTNGEIWDYIKNEKNEFWFNLPVLPDAVEFLWWLSRIPIENDIYFITSRPGRQAKAQTEAWLWKHGYKVSAPTVLISDNKGLCCMALKLDVYIDDKNENCLGALTAGTSTYMLARPWNTEQKDIPRINSLEEFRKKLVGRV